MSPSILRQGAVRRWGRTVRAAGAALLLLVGAGPGLGCYQSHGLVSDEDASVRVAPARDAGARVVPGRDAGGPIEPPDASVPGPPEDIDIPSECETLCAFWMENGCGDSTCMRNCLTRAEQAAMRGCLSQWKAVNECILRSPPCESVGCGMTSGWPECLRGEG